MSLGKTLSNLLGGLGDYLAQSEIIDFWLMSLTQLLLTQPKGMCYEKKPRLRLSPSPEWYPLPTVNQPRSIQLKIELHEAKRAGTHLDLRFLIDDRVYDYAIVKTSQLPSATGQPRLAIRRPNHSQTYFQTEAHTFPEGSYGEGEMRTLWKGEVDLIKSSPSSLEFSIPEGEFQGRYAIHNLEQGSLLVRMKGPVLSHRERMAFQDSDQKLPTVYSDPNTIAEEKIDGANYTLVFGPKENTLVSRRLSVSGEPINKAAHLPQLKYLKGKIAQEFKGKAIHVEVVADKGNVSETAGLLNSNPGLARTKQLSGKPLVLYVWDIESDLPYSQRRLLYKRLEKLSPRLDRRAQGHVKDQLFLVRSRNPKLIRFVKSNEEHGLSPKEFSDKIKNEGKEGVVLKDKTKYYYNDTWLKDKRAITKDLPIIGFTEGTGKYTGSIGAIIVKDPATGAVSKVGTGLSDKERQFMSDYRNIHVNKRRPVYIEVEAHELTHKGVLRGPRFIKYVNPEDINGRVRAKEAAVARRKRMSIS